MNSMRHSWPCKRQPRENRADRRSPALEADGNPRIDRSYRCDRKSGRREALSRTAHRHAVCAGDNGSARQKSPGDRYSVPHQCKPSAVVHDAIFARPTVFGCAGCPHHPPCTALARQAVGAWNRRNAWLSRRRSLPHRRRSAEPEYRNAPEIRHPHCKDAQSEASRRIVPRRLATDRSTTVVPGHWERGSCVSHLRQKRPRTRLAQPRRRSSHPERRRGVHAIARARCRAQ